ncbi:hypothetical protein BKA81DRAFT_364520 [Phyllosticta paracitricarpa]
MAEIDPHARPDTRLPAARLMKSPVEKRLPWFCISCPAFSRALPRHWGQISVCCRCCIQCCPAISIWAKLMVSHLSCLFAYNSAPSKLPLSVSVCRHFSSQKWPRTIAFSFSSSDKDNGRDLRVGVYIWSSHGIDLIFGNKLCSKWVNRTRQ